MIMITNKYIQKQLNAMKHIIITEKFIAEHKDNNLKKSIKKEIKKQKEILKLDKMVGSGPLSNKSYTIL